jgi:heat shock protein HslJ
MRPENVGLGLLIAILIVSLISCRDERERPPMDPFPTTPVRVATSTSPIAAPATSESDPLNGTRWELVSIESKETAPSIPGQPRLFLTFDRSALNLSGGCNSVSGHYVLRDDRIEVTFSKTTEMDCSGRYPGINQVEEAFFYAMSTFESYAIEGDRLAIRYAEGEILLRRAWEHMSTPTPTAVSTWTAASTRTPHPTQTLIALPTVTQTPTAAPFPKVWELLDELNDIKVTQTPTPTPFPKVELPIGALAFIGRSHQLLVRDPAGTICAITEDGTASSPAWSPDGTRLAFSYQARDRSPAELRIYDQADGTQPAIWVDPGDLAPMVLPFRHIAWSSSGRYLFLSQGCCPVGALYLLDLETRTRVGRYMSSRAIWSPGEDLLALSVPQRVERIIPIGSGDSSSIALVHPGDITLTVVLTGTVDRLYHAYAWLPAGELLYQQSDLYDEANRVESSWWIAEIVGGTDGSQSMVASYPLETLPIAYDDEVFEEHLSPCLPGATFVDRVWTPDGTWVVFRAYGDTETLGRIYAFHWEEGQLVGPLAEGLDLALAPVRAAWRCPE